ncbi:MAG: lipopolysaccharide assembly protein LapA domain-containing protein [Actinomycetota bacterium]|nr:lipopolysaccharide assembly protein LapA domain-containing protein [Actinomycetota bacterium]
MALLIVGLLLAIFVLQNTAATEITFLFWSASVPLAGALLLAAVLGGMFASLIVYIRQRQFRHALKSEQARRHSSAETRPSGHDKEGKT